MVGPDRRPAAPGGSRRHRDHRRQVAMEVVRSACAVFSMASVAGVAALPGDVAAASIAAHLGLVLASVGAVAVLPAAERAGRAGQLGAAMTVATIGFYVGTTALWHDVAGAGTALGIVALLEAPARYGWRGAALSGLPVLTTALLLPQADATGATMPEGVTVSLVVLLLAAALTVREVLRRSAAAVSDAVQGFAEAMLHLPLGVAVVDEQGRVTQANPALSALLGGPLEGQLLAAVVDGDADRLERVLSGQVPDQRVICRTTHGREVALGAATVKVTGPHRAVVHVQDVTDDRRERASLLHASRHDALTGLLTRQAGTEVLEQALDDEGPVAVLFLDLDGFKRLNDTAGHAVGDTVLRQVAGRLSHALRPSERAVRWGGDEFVVVCAGVPDAGALASVAQRLLEVLREPFRVPGHPLVRLTASIGGVHAPAGATSAAVLGAADAAMYQAKNAGGDRWAYGSPPLPAPRCAGDATGARLSRLSPG